MTLSAMNERGLIKPRLVCECILVVWSAIYLSIAIRFWILLHDRLLFHVLPYENDPFLRERGFLGGQIFKENMVLCPSRVLFLIACFLILVWRRKKSNKI